MITTEIKDFRYINVASISPDIFEMCLENDGNFLSKSKKKILLTDPDFIKHLNKEFLYKQNKRAETFTIKYWVETKCRRTKSTKFFDLSIVFDKDLAEAAMEQITRLYYDFKDFDFQNWEEYLDYQVKLVALITSWGDYTKDNFKNFPKNKIEEELLDMQKKNYEVSIVKNIMNREHN